MTTGMDRLSTDIELFGGRNRTSVLLAICLLEQTWPSQLAQVLSLRLFAVQRILDALHREGVLASRVAGRTRLVTLNPRYFAAKPLRTLLWDLAKHDVPLQEKLAVLRRRPRQPGKRL